MKTLLEYIADADAEYTIVIKSAADIHTDSMLEQITLVLSKYDLRELKVTGVSPFQTNPPEFPKIPLCQVYSLEAIVGILPDSGAESLREEIAMYAMIPSDAVFVEFPGVETVCVDCDGEPILGTAPGEHPHDEVVSDEIAQDQVGQRRIFNILSDLEKKEESESKLKAEKITKFVTTHMGLKEMFDISKRKGYYECELTESGVRVVAGPFKQKPEKHQVVVTGAQLKKLS